MELDFKPLIDAMDEPTLIEFHQNLNKKGYYNNLYNFEEIGGDIDNIRKVVKEGVKGPSYPDLYEIAPESIRKLIEPQLNEIPEHIEQEPVEISDTDTNVGGEPQPVQLPTPEKPKSSKNKTKIHHEEDTEESGEKTLLLKELYQIADQRDEKGRVPGIFKDRFAEVVTRLSKAYKIPITKLSEMINMGRQNLTPIITNFYRDHPDILDIPFGQPKGGSPDLQFAERGAEKGVKDTIEQELVERAKTITEKYHNLGRNIYDKYSIQAMRCGVDIPTMTITALDMYFKYDDIYQTMLNMELENIALREYIQRLVTRINGIENRNRNLSRTMIMINNLQSIKEV